MRALILVAGAALAVAACGDDGPVRDIEDPQVVDCSENPNRPACADIRDREPAL